MLQGLLIFVPKFCFVYIKISNQEVLHKKYTPNSYPFDTQYVDLNKFTDSYIFNTVLYQFSK